MVLWEQLTAVNKRVTMSLSTTQWPVGVVQEIFLPLSFDSSTLLSALNKQDFCSYLCLMQEEYCLDRGLNTLHTSA